MAEEFRPTFISKYNKLYCTKNTNSGKEVSIPKYTKSETRRLPKYGFERFRSIN